MKRKLKLLWHFYRFKATRLDVDFFLKQNENTVLFFLFSCLFLSYSHQSVNTSIGGVYFPRQWCTDTGDGWSWSWNGKSHQDQACNFIFISGMLLPSHNANESLEKDNVRGKSPSSISKMKIETRFTRGRITVQNVCQLYGYGRWRITLQVQTPLQRVWSWPNLPKFYMCRNNSGYR